MIWLFDLNLESIIQVYKKNNIKMKKLDQFFNFFLFLGKTFYKLLQSL